MHRHEIKIDARDDVTNTKIIVLDANTNQKTITPTSGHLMTAEAVDTEINHTLSSNFGCEVVGNFFSPTSSNWKQPILVEIKTNYSSILLTLSLQLLKFNKRGFSSWALYSSNNCIMYLKEKVLNPNNRGGDRADLNLVTLAFILRAAGFFVDLRSEEVAIKDSFQTFTSSKYSRFSL